MTHITYEDFAKVEVRIGRIISVEEVPDTDKLLKLLVDFGETVPRQIISGIKHKVSDPQALVGMSTTFVTNLEPRTIKGFESNGMLFAIGGDQDFSFLIPQDNVPLGSIAR